MDKTYPTNVVDSPGWLSIRHLLKKGSKAKVYEVDYYGGEFKYQIQFLENTYIDNKDVVHPASYSANTVITLEEKWLRKSKLPKGKISSERTD
jgi:hypothetical protein